MGRRSRNSTGRSTAVATNRPRSPRPHDGDEDSATASFTTMANNRNPYTYRGPNAGPNVMRRFHQEFKSLSKEERQRLVEEEAADTDLLARTVHLRFLPTSMLQSELAALCNECGEFLRVRICGNATNTQNWIYGFVEFADRHGADELMRRNGKELPNGPGKPPLRLKCNSAKQPIVDRVFHDADPATNNACIFGSGNFAHRTLKEAVDSYHNLKKKESGLLLLAAKGSHPGKFMYRPSSPVGPAPYPKANRNRDDPFFAHAAHFGDAMGCDPHGLFPGAAHTCHHGLSLPTTDAASEEESPGATPHMHHSAINHKVIAASDMGTQSLYAHFPGSDAASCDWQLISPRVDTLPQAATMIAGPWTKLSCESHIFTRAQALVVSAMASAHSFVTSQQHFYDAIGALRTLLSVLDKHASITGGPETAVTDTEVAEGPQRATQLRLLAHLLLSLLYSMKGNTEEALASIHAIVTYCDSIPTARLHSLTLPSVQDGGLLAEQQGNRVSSVGVSTEGKVVTIPDGDDRFLREDEMCNPLSQGIDLLSEINMNGDDMADQYAEVVKDALGILTLDDFDDSLGEPRRGPCFLRDINFHSYIINVLLTVGLSMESILPVVSRCVYVVASRRAMDILGVSLPELEHALMNGGDYHLCSTLFPQLPLVNDQFAFAKAFFETYTISSSMMFWMYMPPLHMVDCFPQTKEF